jgi:hypothetical protein
MSQEGDPPVNGSEDRWPNPGHHDLQSGDADGAGPPPNAYRPPDGTGKAAEKPERFASSVLNAQPWLQPAAPVSCVESDPASNSQDQLPRAPQAVQLPDLQIVEVTELDWQSVKKSAEPAAVRAGIRPVVEQMESLLDKINGPAMLFDECRTNTGDLTLRVSNELASRPMWFIGDLHGDLLALEAALATIDDQASRDGSEPNIVFLGDLFDDEGFGLEVLLRVFKLICDRPGGVCLIAGNHDEALSFDGTLFASVVSPSDFVDFLNANRAHEWIERAGKLAVRVFTRAPRALFFADGLLVAHGGFPLADLHPQLAATGDWNDPTCLSDFVWTRAHPKARKKIPNRHSRGSQFGYEDFAAFCELSASLGRPITHMIRGHDHVEQRYAFYPAYKNHPVLTTVALSRRLSREGFGPHERVPTIAQYVQGATPRVYRLHIPEEIIREFYPETEHSDPGEGDNREPC